MKTKITALIFILALLFWSSSQVSAVADQEAESKTLLGNSGFTIYTDVNFSNKYVWRGILLDIDPVVQPGFYLTSPEIGGEETKLGKIKLSFWLSNPLQKSDALQSAEQDYIVDYTYDGFESFTVSLGNTYFDFPDLIPADGAPEGWSREAYLGFALPKVWLTPSVYYYYDYGKKEDGGGQGSYTAINLAHSQPFSISDFNLSLDVNGHVGFNNKQYFTGKGGDVGLTASITAPLTKSISLKPNINYAVPWGNLSDSANGNQKSRVYYGIYLSATF
jgi:hypothetical protein